MMRTDETGDTCCAPTEAATTPRYRRVLYAVLLINLGGFVVEATAGALSGSLSLQADALDFLGDAANYGIALFVLSRSILWRSAAAIGKAGVMGAFGLWILGSVVYRVFVLGLPSALVMGTVGTIALVANIICAVLLYRYREGDSNMRSVWLCTRNDVLGNLAVIGAALLVGATATAWPDLVVAFFIAALAISSATAILRQALGERRQHFRELARNQL